MAGKSLAKITKQINSKKSPLHPKGRKARLLSRATIREEKIEKKRLGHTAKKAEEYEIVGFLQEIISTQPPYDSQSTFTISDIKLFIMTFINRDEDELKELKASRRPGRPAHKRQDVIEIKMKKESHLFKHGWELPDLTDEDVVKLLRTWKGDRGGITSMKFRIFKQSDEDLDTGMQ